MDEGSCLFILLLLLECAMKKFVRKITTPSNAGREKGGSSRSSCSSDISGEPSDSTPRAKPTKRKPESPSESLCPSTESVDRPMSGTRKAACKSGATLDQTSDSPSASDRDSQVVVSQMKVMLDSFQAQLRTELKSLVKDTLAGLLKKFDDLHTTVSEQRLDINRLSAENRRLKAAIEKCTEDVVISENGAKSAIAEVKQTVATFTARHPVANLTSPNPAGNAIQGTSEATLLDLVAEATDKSSRVNNIVLRGLLESPSEDLPAIISTLAPQVAPGDILSATRIGQSRSNSTGAVTLSARLVRAVLSPTTKAQLMHHKPQAKHKGENVYIQHDLTRQEQARRKELVPKFRALRSKGVKCHLPRDAITLNGKHLTSEDIARLLTSQSQ
eukprot:scpid51029/ scgid25628/ 